MNIQQAGILYNATCEDGLTKWTVVAWSESLRKYVRADYSALYGTLGILFSDRAAPIGILVSNVRNGKATIAVEGLITDLNNRDLDDMSESSGLIPGRTCYLSVSEAGKLTTVKPPQPIQVGNIGTNFMVVQPSQAIADFRQREARIPIGMRHVGSQKVLGSVRTPTAQPLFDVDVDPPINFGTDRGLGCIAVDGEMFMEMSSPVFVLIRVQSVNTYRLDTYLMSDLSDLDTAPLIGSATNLSIVVGGTAYAYDIQLVAEGPVVGRLYIKWLETPPEPADSDAVCLIKFPDSVQGWKPVVDSDGIQVFDWESDFPSFPVPSQFTYYYNIKADIRLRKSWPMVPVRNSKLILNGVVQEVGSPQEAIEYGYDIATANNTLLWKPSSILPWADEWTTFDYSLIDNGGTQVLTDNVGYVNMFEDVPDNINLLYQALIVGNTPPDYALNGQEITFRNQVDSTSLSVADKVYLFQGHLPFAFVPEKLIVRVSTQVPTTPAMGETGPVFDLRESKSLTILYTPLTVRAENGETGDCYQYDLSSLPGKSYTGSVEFYVELLTEVSSGVGGLTEQTLIFDLVGRILK